MRKEDYKVIPSKIKSPKDLIDFLSPIPHTKWCVDIRDNGEGQHCVLGHLDNVYGCQKGRDGFNDNVLATVNNGTIGCAHGPRKPGAKTSGRAAKMRVLNFLKKHVK